MASTSNVLSIINAGVDTSRCASKIKFLTLIGSGSFGKVYTAKLTDESATIAAVKIIHREIDVHIINEIDIMKMLVNVPYVVKFLDEYWTSTDAFIVMDFVQGGDLFTYVTEHEKIAIAQIRIWAAELAYTIHQLHNLHIIYNDIKIENILIDATGHIALTDFGLASVLTPPYKAYHSKGTVNYMAPEIFATALGKNVDGYSFEIDWWAFGLLIYELLTTNIFYNISEQNSNHKIYKILMREIHRCDITRKVGDADAADLIYRCLQKNPLERLGRNFNDVMNHPFFKSINWNDIRNQKAPAIHVPILKDAADCHYFQSSETGEISTPPILNDNLIVPRPTIVQNSLPETVTQIDKCLLSSKSYDDGDRVAADQCNSTTNSMPFTHEMHKYEAFVLLERIKMADYNLSNPSNQRKRKLSLESSREMPKRPTKIFRFERNPNCEALSLFDIENSTETTDSHIKIFHKGIYVNLDKEKFLKWMETRVNNLVKTCAVSNAAEQTMRFNLRPRIKKTNSGRNMKTKLTRKPFSVK